MAGDYVMVEHATKGKPEVLHIATELNIHPCFAFGLCITAWMWFDEQTEDGRALRATEKMLDSVVAFDGFSHALRNAGWLQVRDGSLEIPNFDRLMGESAKKRAKNTRRQRVLRDKKEEKDGQDLSRFPCDKSATKAKGKVLSYSNRTSDRSGDPIDLSPTGKLLREKLGEPKSSSDVKFYALVGRAVDEGWIAERLVAESLVGIEKGKNRVAFFRAAIQSNVKSLGKDFESMLDELEGAQNAQS
jgi:hypothetical protein